MTWIVDSSIWMYSIVAANSLRCMVRGRALRDVRWWQFFDREHWLVLWLKILLGCFITGSGNGINLSILPLLVWSALEIGIESKKYRKRASYCLFRNRE